MNKHPILVVRIILENPEGEFLFLKRASLSEGANQWCLPGGKVNSGKTLEETCLNELKDETFLDISNLEFLFYDEGLPIKEGKLHYITFYFIADYSGKARRNNESSDLRWIAPSDLGNYEVAFSHDKALIKYLEG